MRRTTWLFVAALVLGGCSSSAPDQAIVNGAAAALGGASKIQAVNTLVIEGTGENGNLGQSTTPDALNVFKVSESKRVFDFAGGRQRLEQTRIGWRCRLQRRRQWNGDARVHPNCQGQADGDVSSPDWRSSRRTGTRRAAIEPAERRQRRCRGHHDGAGRQIHSFRR